MYLQDMHKVRVDQPEEWTKLTNQYHNVRRTNAYYCAISTDLAIEQVGAHAAPSLHPLCPLCLHSLYPPRPPKPHALVHPPPPHTHILHMLTTGLHFSLYRPCRCSWRT